MKTITQKIKVQAFPQKVFETLDDLSISGMHMTKSSAMMMGSKLHLQYLTEHHNGPGSKYRWTGNMMGIKMDFTVEVTKWVRGVEKVWETIGDARMIIYSWYRMHLLVKPIANGSEAELSISYKKPKGWFARAISFLFADWYCNWCLKNMLNDSKQIIESNKLKTSIMKLKASKFGIALGLAFAIGFLLCNLIFVLGGDNFSLAIMNSIFHKTDFKSIMVEEGFNIGKLLTGVAALLVTGTFIGYFSALIYNTGTKNVST